MNTCIFALIVAVCALGAGAINANCAPLVSFLNSGSFPTGVGLNPNFTTSTVYIPGKTCFHTVTVLNANAIVVNMTVLLASPSSDRLEIFKGWNTTAPSNLVARLYGRGYRYSALIYIPDQNFTVTFVSDALPKSATLLGYRINATAAAASDWQHCVGAGSTLDLANLTSSATIQEPAAQWGVMPYLWNATCGWRIQAPAGKFVNLSLITFQVESGFDALTFYDGDNETAPLLGGVSGNQVQPRAPWISSGRSMYVTFRSSATISDATMAPGFRLIVSVATLSSICPATPVPILASSAGCLVWPGYVAPNVVFPPGQCSWQLSGEVTERINVCLPFDVHGLNPTETVRFYDGTRIDPDRELFFNMDGALTSGTNQVLVVLTQDLNAPPPLGQWSSLVLQYSTVDSAEEPVCRSTTSVIAEDVPGVTCDVPIQAYWHSYGGPLTCLWNVKPAIGDVGSYGVFVYFYNIDLALGDFIDVSDSEGTHLGTVTSANNNADPVSFRTAYTQINFIFQINSGVTNHKGFSYGAARYPTPAQCGTTSLSAASGFLSAPSPYGLAPYALPDTGPCTWLITVPIHQVTLVLYTYNLAPGDRLSFYAGTSATGTLLATFTGVNEPPIVETIVGASLTMFVVLEGTGPSGMRWQNTGFNASFHSPVALAPLGTCAGVAASVYANSYTFVSSLNWMNDNAQRLLACTFSFVALNKTAVLLVNVTSLLAGDSSLEIFDGPPGAPGTALFTCAPDCPASLSSVDGNFYAYAVSGNVTIVYTTGSRLGQSNALGRGFQATITTTGVTRPAMCQQILEPSPGGIVPYLRAVTSNPDGVFSTGGQSCVWMLTTTAGGHFSGIIHANAQAGARFLIYDGRNSSSPLVVNCTGWQCDDDWVSTGNVMYAVYNPPSRLGPGEELGVPAPDILYSEIPPASMCSDAPVFASYSETSITQYFAVSYFDSNRRQIQGHVRASMSCPTTIYAPPGYQLVIDVALDLADLNDWSFKLTGSMETANPQQLLSCKQVLPSEYPTPLLAGNQALVEFTTGPAPIYIPRWGFMLTVKVTKAPVFCSGYRHIYAPVIAGEGWAVPYSMPEMEASAVNVYYPRNTRCVYDIETAPGLYLTIAMTTNTEYLGDIVTVYEGSINGPVMLRTSGDTSNSVTSRCHRITIVFEANNIATLHDRGFTFILQANQYIADVYGTNFNFPAECRTSITRGACNWRSTSQMAAADLPVFGNNCETVLGDMPFGQHTETVAVNFPYLTSMTGQWSFVTVSQTVFNVPNLTFLAGMAIGQTQRGGGDGGGGGFQVSLQPRKPVAPEIGSDDLPETETTMTDDTDGAVLTHFGRGFMRPLTQSGVVGGGGGPGTVTPGGGVSIGGGADDSDDPTTWPPPYAQANFSFPALAVAGCIYVGPSQYTNYINMTSLKQISMLYVDTVRTAKYIDLTSLVYIQSDLSLSSLRSLRQILAPNLQRVGRNFNVLSMPFLPTIDFPVLASVGAQIAVDGTSSIFNITWPSLERAQMVYMAALNTKVTFVSAPKLISAGIFLLTQKAMKYLDLPLLWTAPAAIYTRTLPQIVNISLPSLRSGSLQISDMAALSGVYAPQLVYTNIQISDNPGVSSLNFPLVVNLAFDSFIANNRLMSSVNMCNLRYSVGATLSVTNSPALSCFDLQTAYASLLDLFPAVSPQCSDISGIFGCYRNTTLSVRPDLCGYNVGCIQHTINQALRHALVQVYVPAGTYTGCATAPLDLAGKDITLFGEGPATTVIDCQGAGRAMVMQTGEKSTTLIHSMGFTNGAATTGGLVYIKDASPILYNCAFDQSTATGSGGAVALVGDSHPILSMVTFTGNAATSGGALSSDGSFILTDATFTSNSAAREGGAIRVGDDSDSRLTNLTRVTMTLNQAQRGAGILAVGSIALADSTLRDNTATQLGGGAMLVPTAALGTWYHVSNTLIESNTALHGGGVYSFSGNLDLSAVNLHANSAQLGGGMFATCNENYRFLNGINGYCDVMVRMNGVRVASNVASVDGGGLALREVEIYVTNSTLFRNGAAGKGGGMQVGSAALTWRGGVMSDNSASYGGGVHVEAFTGTTNITSALITRNTASTAGAGAFLCTAACPGYNTSNDAPVTTGVLPNLPAMNTFVDNDVDESGYGSDVGTDPAQLIWESAPPSTMISGQPASIAISVTIEDYFQQPVSSRTSPLLLSLFVRLPGANEATSRVSIQGGQSVIATKGRAEFTGANFVASNISYVNADYDVECRLSALSTVAIRSRVTLMPCVEGQGIPGQVDGPINCQFCPAGTIDVTPAVDACQPCAPGSFSARIGSTDLCEPCPVNTTAKQAGAVACDKCADGQVALLVGSTDCAAVDAITGVAVQSLYVPVLGALAGFFCIGCLAAIYMCRYARRRTLKKYYLDNDSTVRTGSVETPLQKEVKKMILAASTVRLGGGVFADVYKARYNGRWVALKVLKGEMVGNSIAIAEFQRETVALSRLSERAHPGIVGLNFFLQKNPMSIGVEFCEMGTVKAYITQPRAFPDLARLVAETAAGMTVLHELSIAHLDLKTDNLLLDADCHVKIADFGISRTVGNDVHLTPSEFINGSLKNVNSTSSSVNNGGDVATRPTSTQGGYVNNPVFGSDQHENGSVAYAHAYAAGATTGAHSSTSSGHSGAGIGADKRASRPISQGSAAYGMPSMGGISASEFGTMTPEVDAAFTPQYVDPARITQSRLDDLPFLCEADVYSYAMVMWAMASQAEPYAGIEPMNLIAQLKANPDMRPEVPIRAPKFYIMLMARCWDADRSMRPTFRDIAHELATTLQQEYGINLAQTGYWA